jgi:hypothetical protein
LLSGKKKSEGFKKDVEVATINNLGRFNRTKNTDGTYTVELNLKDGKNF